MPQQVSRTIDKVLKEFSDSHQKPFNRTVQFIVIPFLTFSVLGLVWSVPFPYLGFLGKYNGFFNWASLLIAFSVYYYYKVSPVLSYPMFLLVFLFSAIIVSLEKLHRTAGWPSLGQICFCIFGASILLQYTGYSAEGKFPSAVQSLKRLLIGPLWLFSIVFQKIGIKV